MSAIGALESVEELRIDSKIGKGKHFAAGGRKLFWHRVFGVPVIVVNLFVGMVLVENHKGSQRVPIAPIIRLPAM